MIDNINRLSLSDKLYMIVNPSSFSLSNRSLINFYKNEWTEDIEKNMNPGVIELEYDEYENLKLRCNNVVEDSGNETVCKELNRFYKKVIFTHCESKENIKDLLCLFNIELDWLIRNIDLIPINGRKDYFSKITVCFLDLLRYKVRAHEIVVNNNCDIAPGDEELRSFYDHYISHLITELITSDNDRYLALISYLLLTYLEVDESTKFPEILDSIVGAKLRKYHSVIMDTLVTMLKGKVNPIAIIDSICVEPGDKMMDLMKREGKLCIEKNYKKDKVSDILRNGELCIGDSVFGDKPINLESLMREIYRLNTECIKDYVGENKVINFSISEREVGYLKMKEKLPVCKVLTKKDGFYTLTRYEDISYLLFKMYNDNKCYGISFPEGFKGERKVVIFDIPRELDYKLEI